MTETEQKEFGAYIKGLREAQSLCVKSAARAVGISDVYMYQIERGHRNAPKIDVLKKLAVVYRVRLSEMMRAAGILAESEKASAIEAQKIDNAFEFVRRDPDYVYGSHIDPSTISLDAKRLLIQVYEKANDLKILKGGLS